MRLVLPLLLLLAAEARAGLLVGFEAASLRHTTAAFDYSGVETFDRRGLGRGMEFSTDFGTAGQAVRIEGTYRNLDIIRGDQYGGDEGSPYAVTFGRDGYTLDLAAFDGSTGERLPITYFGFWLSALDRQNQVEFSRGGQVIHSFTPADVLAWTGACPGEGNAYCGNPLDGERRRNTQEAYVFVNFFETTGEGFDRLRFFQSPDGGGYESDNHTVGFFVASGEGTAVPAPAALALFGLALFGLSVARRWRRFEGRAAA